ncbi:MAG: SDR family oxidoreductase [Devosia nanyangense]|nr:SDR family oxidoreductase [Devosia nanyangense]
MIAIPTYPDLAGKTAFITGASGGIGAETARWLAHNGVRLALNGRDQAKLNTLANELTAAGATALPVQADNTDASALEQARYIAEEEFGDINLLFAFAGGGTARPAPVEQTEEADWRSAIDHNLTATFLAIKTFLPAMKERRAGAIVTMASTAGRGPSQASPAYGAAKAGIILLTQDVASEVGPEGVRVNCISPSAILTDRTAANMPELVQKQVAASHPLRRIGLPEDVAAAALFLASSSAGWITGATLDVAGGRMMH